MKIEVESSNMRLDQYLSESVGMSRSKIQKLIKDGRVLVNGKEVSSSYSVKIGDMIDFPSDFSFEIHIEGEELPLDIRYEDEDLLVVNKESGMVVHPAPGNYSGTLVNALLGRGQIEGGESFRPGIVHRIDKDTSGVLVVAKNDETHEKLSEMIKKKEVKRVYYALVDGIIPHETGTIDAPIGRDPDNRQKMKVTDQNSKDAITHFKVLKRYMKQKKTLIECVLDTGRTHQIRVHMNYIGYPIYNDPVYGKSKKVTSFGQFLHSKKIEFQHPRTKKEIQIEVELPEEFKNYLEELDRLEKENNV